MNIDRAKQLIRNPEKWVGKYVRHMANWQDFEWHENYAVCSWTGKLIRLEDAYEATAEEAEILNNSHLSFYFDKALYYSAEGIADMLKSAQAKQAA